MEDKRQKKDIPYTQKPLNRMVPCEVYSRVTGFYRPISQFNAGKKEEFRERRFLYVKKIKKAIYAASSNDMV